MSGGIARHIFKLGARWRWVVSFTPRLLYHRQYPLDRRLGGYQSRSRRGGKENESFFSTGNRTPVVEPLA